MKTNLSDTNPKIEAIQIKLLKQKTFSQKFSLIESLSSLTINLSKRAIIRKNPHLTTPELNLLFVKFNYGEDLYKKVRLYIMKSSHGKE